jgi:nitrate/TMAO reductase-like tetraheme cytochrome c subunit
VLLLDNGDVNKGYGRQPELKYETAMKAMAEMEYDAVNIGEQDLVLGIGYLRYVADYTGIPLLSANMMDASGAPIFQQYLLKEFSASAAPVSAAVIGIISPDFQTDIAEIAPDIRIEDYEPILNELAFRLRPQVDLLILLAHANEEEAIAIARNFPQFDLIIVSHSGDDPLVMPEEVNGVPIAFAGTHGMHVGMATFACPGKKAVLRSYKVEKLEEKYEDSMRMVSLLQDYQQMLKAERLLEHYPRSDYGELTFTGNQSCKRCHSLSTMRYKKDEHAHAFDIIVEKNHAHDPECVRCHTVGFGYTTGFRSSELTPDLKHVGCEDCHGPGSKHIEQPTESNYGEVTKETCEACHNVENSPKFAYDEYVKKINHNSFFLCSAKICHWFD